MCQAACHCQLVSRPSAVVFMQTSLFFQSKSTLAWSSYSFTTEFTLWPRPYYLVLHTHFIQKQMYTGSSSFIPREQSCSWTQESLKQDEMHIDAVVSCVGGGEHVGKEGDLVRVSWPGLWHVRPVLSPLLMSLRSFKSERSAVSTLPPLGEVWNTTRKHWLRLCVNLQRLLRF